MTAMTPGTLIATMKLSAEELRRVEEASEAARKGLEAKFAAGGWEKEEEGDGITVYRGPCFEEGVPAFQGHVSVRGGEVGEVLHALTDLSTRLMWDGATLSPLSSDLAILSPSLRLRRSVSLPALGGAISSREFIDLMADHVSPDGTSAFQWCVSCPDLVKFVPTKGTVLGRNFHCGLRLTKQADGMILVEFLLHSVVNGWLPASIVTRAMPVTLRTMAQSLRSFLERKAPV